MMLLASKTTRHASLNAAAAFVLVLLQPLATAQVAIPDTQVAIPKSRAPGPGDSPEAKGPRPANPRDLTGKWNRVTEFQSFGAVKGGANEFQNEILDAQNTNRQPDLSQAKARIKGLKYADAVFTPAGKAAFDKNFPGYGLRIGPPRLGNDPQGNCDPWGVPRMLNGQVAGPHATWEIIQEKDRMWWYVPWHHEVRMVWMDGRKLPTLDEVDPVWNGYSVGHWEGNTLVINSMGFNEKTWLDHNGYPHTFDMKLEERYRLLDANTLELTMTLTDPEYYAQPFKSDVKIWKRDTVTNKEWDQNAYCVASEEGRFNHLIRDGQVGK
jgi:hypothetical protein